VKPISASPEVLVDTSIAVALVVADHEHHGTTVAALAARRLGLAGHAAFETFSVLTRLPPPARRSPGAVARLLAFNFPATRALGGPAAADLLDRLGPLNLSGGAVYDALVAAAAAEHGMTLVTRDRRALGTYRALDVDVELLA
jgi:predicted nucleic acid-binding protein